MSDVIVASQTSVVVAGDDREVVVAGQRGAQGEAGIGVPAGGTAGQVLAKGSSTNYDTEWADQTGGGADLSDDNALALGVADAGTGEEASRDDHVHPMPSAADVGASAVGHGHVAGDIDAEASTDGQVLTSDGAGGAAWEDIPAGSSGSTPIGISGEEPGVLVDGLAWSGLVPVAGALSSGAASCGTAPTGAMTLVIVVGGDTITFTWTPGNAIATSVTGLPATVAAGDLITATLATSAGAQNLRYYLTGVAS